MPPPLDAQVKEQIHTIGRQQVLLASESVLNSVLSVPRSLVVETPQRTSPEKALVCCKRGIFRRVLLILS
jgi:hypothetical protein